MIKSPRNKAESEQLIHSCGCNYLHYHLVNHVDELIKIICTIEKSDAKFSFRMMNPLGGGSLFMPNLDLHATRKAIWNTKNGVLKTLIFPCQLYINDGNHDNSRIYQGEFLLREDNTMDVWYNDIDNMKMRHALRTKNAKHLVNVPWNVMANKFKVAVEYICKYAWINSVVELSYHYDKVGINNDNILIWEVRGSY